MTSASVIVLTLGDLSAGVLPACGGALGWFRHRSTDLLRPATAGATDARETACFPMVPFASRIRDGRIDGYARRIQLPGNDESGRHALHGFGWQRSWTVRSTTASTCAIEHIHTAGAWPWDYVATQAIALVPGALQIDLAITNASPQPMPCGLGLHPYFPARPWPRARAAIDAIAVMSDDKFPIGRLMQTVALDALRTGEPVPHGLDHGFAGWRGTLDLRWPTHALHIEADATFLTIYTPEDGDFLCIEPVTHWPNALAAPPEHWPGLGIATIAPGARHQMQLRLQHAV